MLTDQTFAYRQSETGRVGIHNENSQCDRILAANRFTSRDWKWLYSTYSLHAFSPRKHCVCDGLFATSRSLAASGIGHVQFSSLLMYSRRENSLCVMDYSLPVDSLAASGIGMFNFPHC
ncbi:hypothetical protein EVAR_7325_1 [Eumeta japonica]|uniref:Uncharacterized protein n=1 Tax=Eumeta variegata TaxID=151549 RepID=A0A4C1T2L9_EUMVA|nr:hypothetical protein EVAR_7325_1 [Eumeta japonica]